MEEILYDTNILIEFIKRNNFTIDGYTTILNVIEFPKAVSLKNLKVIYPNTEDYYKSLIIAAKLLKRGTPIPAIDIIIAAVSINYDLVLITKDRHFKYIKMVEPKFKLQIAHM